MPITLDGSLGVTTPTYNGNTTAEYLVPVTQFKNRLINSAMVIDQRNAGASITGNDGAFPLDRFTILATQSSKLTVQQSTVAPAGFGFSLLATSSSAYSVLSSDQFTIQQRIEGFNTADLNFGTASASTVTLSFWVRSSLTGTFGGALTNNAYNRTYPFSYSISAANTWEYKTITIAGDTTGTWVGATNGVGLRVSWSLGAGASQSGTAGAWAASSAIAATGQVNLVGTNGATFYLTGVQLERGSTATSFDYRPYGTELALCQRYFISYGGSDANEQFSMGLASSATSATCVMGLPVEMRAVPSIGFNSASAFLVNDSSVQNATSAISTAVSGTKNVFISATTSGLTQGRAVRFMANSSLATRLTFSAEL